MILGGALQPGDRLRVEELSQQFGVSDMPVREALHQLAAEGTAVLDPYRGFSIAELSPDEVEDLYATRAPLKELATRIAIPLLAPITVKQLRNAESGIDAIVVDLDLLLLPFALANAPRHLLRH